MSKKGIIQMARKENYNKRSNTRDARGNTGIRNHHDFKIEAHEGDINRFFTESPAMVKDTCSLNFARVLGDTFRLLPPSAFHESVALNRQMNNAPGIMVFETRFTPGRSDAAYSAPNVAALQLYTRIRRDVNGAKNYDPADILMHLMTVDTVYVWYQCLKRVYAAIQTGFSSSSRYTPKVIVEAMGFDYESLINDLPTFRSIFHQFISKMNTFYIPKMPYFAWHRELFDCLYADADTPAAQLYMFKPDGLYEYIETEHDPITGVVTQMGYLKYHPWGWVPGSTHGAAKYSVQNIATMCNFFMTHVSVIEDIGTMNGDIMRAYGEDVFKLEDLDPTATLQIWYNQSILNAIENMDIAPILSEDTQNITQDTSIGAGGLYYMCEAGLPKILNQSTLKYINILNGYTDPEHVMEATRFMNVATSQNFIHGTEIITQVEVYRLLPSTVVGPPSDTIEMYVVQSNVINSYSELINVLDLFTEFTVYPRIFYYTTDGAETNPETKLRTDIKIYSNTNCYDLFSTQQLNDMHNAAIMSLWSVEV